ncbi:MAG: hypothetical protein ACREMZ_10940 [Gemmatimonadales bacterium]
MTTDVACSSLDRRFDRDFLPINIASWDVQEGFRAAGIGAISEPVGVVGLTPYTDSA